MAFCQGLLNNNAHFSFNLSIGKDNNFNFKNNESEKTHGIKKKKSPSQIRREKRRRDERIVKKPNTDTVKVSENVSASKSDEGNAKMEIIHFQCNQCEMNFESEKGLKIHIGKSHKIYASVKTPEKERGSCTVEELSLNLSPKKRADDETVANSTLVEESEEDSLLLSKTDEVMMPIMIKAEAQEKEFWCINQISEYQEMILFLARANKEECCCSACSPGSWKTHNKKKT